MPGEAESDEALVQGYEGLLREMKGALDYVRGHFLYSTDIERAEAHRHIARTLLLCLERDFLQDPDYPFFRVLDWRSKEGMDNSDQRYLLCPLDPTKTYRVHGSRGTTRRLDLQILRGIAFDQVDGAGELIGVLTTDDLQIAQDGSFEVFLGGEDPGSNWLPLVDGPQSIMIRQISSDWACELPGDIHIDCLETLGTVRPSPSSEEMAARWRATASHFGSLVRYWPEFGQERWVALAPANTLLPPRDLSDVGGLPGRDMAGGHFDLAPDEALIVSTWPSKAAYQGIQLGHHWWESLEYADRQTSLSTDQAHLSSDGRYHFVIAHADPGVPNWLDTEGFHRGMILLRWDGAPERLRKTEWPTAHKVALADVRNHLPEDEPIPTLEDRSAALRARRAHVQRRFSC